MTGACNAAIHDKIRFNKIKGYGSKPLFCNQKTLKAIQSSKKPKKEIKAKKETKAKVN